MFKTSPRWQSQEQHFTDFWLIFNRQYISVPMSIWVWIPDKHYWYIALVHLNIVNILSIQGTWHTITRNQHCKMWYTYTALPWFWNNHTIGANVSCKNILMSDKNLKRSVFFITQNAPVAVCSLWQWGCHKYIKHQ